MSNQNRAVGRLCSAGLAVAAATTMLTASTGVASALTVVRTIKTVTGKDCIVKKDDKKQLPISCPEMKFNEQSDFSGLDLSRANFQGSEFKDVDLKDLNLQGANLSETKFHFVEMQGANIANTDTENASWLHSLVPPADYDWNKQLGHITVEANEAGLVTVKAFSPQLLTKTKGVQFRKCSANDGGQTLINLTPRGAAYGIGCRFDTSSADRPATVREDLNSELGVEKMNVIVKPCGTGCTIS